MATQADLVVELQAINTELVKIGTETSTLLQKVADLQTALANAGIVSLDLQAAVDAVAKQAKAVDDLVPDVAPTPPPVVPPPHASDRSQSLPAGRIRRSACLPSSRTLLRPSGFVALAVRSIPCFNIAACGVIVP